MKLCIHCSRPISTVVICRYCRTEVNPIKAETLVLIAGGILLAGVLFGSLIFIK